MKTIVGFLAVCLILFIATFAEGRGGPDVHVICPGR